MRGMLCRGHTQSVEFPFAISLLDFSFEARGERSEGDVVRGICARRETINGRGVSGTLVSEKGTWRTHDTWAITN